MSHSTISHRLSGGGGPHLWHVGESPVYLMGGPAKQACDAASMGIQSFLGLVCDSMCALVQVPCFIRNMTCASSAMVCANAAMAGLDIVVSVEEMTYAVTSLGTSC